MKKSDQSNKAAAVCHKLLADVIPLALSRDALRYLKVELSFLLCLCSYQLPPEWLTIEIGYHSTDELLLSVLNECKLSSFEPDIKLFFLLLTRGVAY